MTKVYKLSAILFIVLVFSFLLMFSSSWLLKTEAQNNTPLQGSYALQLNGVVPGANSTLSTISIVGQIDIDNQAKITGLRTLVVSGVGVIPGGTFNCQISDATANGTGKLVCQVVDAVTGPSGRTDTFFYVLANKRKEMKLTLIGGVPGAVVSGVAQRQ
jgi:hypothetical protein